MKKNLKAQIKMGESVAVMVVFFILLMFGFTFYSKFQEYSYKKEMEKQNQLKVLQVSQKASYIPELQCTIQNVQTDNCFDMQKINYFNKLTESENEHVYYYNLFGNSLIYVEDIFPNPENYTVYNASLEDVQDAEFEVLTSNVPVALFNASSNKYAIGILRILYYFEK
jgi:preprotein translocase subunit YajC